jgi:hypothetical protein
MEATTASGPGSGRPMFSGNSLVLLALLGTLALAAALYFPVSTGTLPDHRLKMEKSSGKNGKHANPKARESAEREYQRVKKELDGLNNRPAKPGGRSPEDKKLLKKLREQLNH